jgi:hypothetical protein
LAAQEFDDITDSGCGTTASEFLADFDALNEMLYSDRLEEQTQKVELADDELKVERRVRQAVARVPMLVVGFLWLATMVVSGYYIDLTDWDLQTKRYCKWIVNGIIASGNWATVVLLSGFSFHDLLSGFLGECCPSGDWCHTGG